MPVVETSSLSSLLLGAAAVEEALTCMVLLMETPPLPVNVTWPRGSALLLRGLWRLLQPSDHGQIKSKCPPSLSKTRSKRLQSAGTNPAAPQLSVCGSRFLRCAGVDPAETPHRDRLLHSNVWPLCNVRVTHLALFASCKPRVCSRAGAHSRPATHRSIVLHLLQPTSVNPINLNNTGGWLTTWSEL